MGMAGPCFAVSNWKTDDTGFDRPARGRTGEFSGGVEVDQVVRVVHHYLAHQLDVAAVEHQGQVRLAVQGRPQYTWQLLAAGCRPGRRTWTGA
jgi:hypothetical protein